MTFDSGPAPYPLCCSSPGVSSFTLGGLKGAANLALPDTSGAGITLAVGNNNQNTTYTGVLSDTGGAAASGLTKIGTGTLHLTAVQTYTGPTFVNNGTLSLNGASIAASSAVQVGGPTSTGPNTNSPCTEWRQCRQCDRWARLRNLWSGRRQYRECQLPDNQRWRGDSL